jgi:hypothetical protein
MVTAGNYNYQVTAILILEKIERISLVYQKIHSSGE